MCRDLKMNCLVTTSDITPTSSAPAFRGAWGRRFGSTVLNFISLTRIQVGCGQIAERSDQLPWTATCSTLTNTTGPQLRGKICPSRSASACTPDQRKKKDRNGSFSSKFRTNLAAGARCCRSRRKCGPLKREQHPIDFPFCHSSSSLGDE